MVKKITLLILLKALSEDSWPLTLLAQPQQICGLLGRSTYADALLWLSRTQQRKDNTEARNVLLSLDTIPFLEGGGLLILWLIVSTLSLS